MSVSVPSHKSPLLTQSEAVHYLRLDEPGGPKHPDCTLKRYRDLGLLRCVRVGRAARYHIDDLESLVSSLRERAHQ